jgi:hypothetical protein
MAGLNGITIVIGGYHARIDQIVSVLLFFALLYNILSGKQKLILEKSGILLVIFLLYTLITTILFAPDLKYSFMQTLSIISVAITFVLINNMIRNEQQLNKFIKYFMVAGILHCSNGILLFVLSSLGLINYGANLIDEPSVPYGVYGTMVEPNIYGGYCLGYFIFSSVMFFVVKESKRTISFLLGVSFVGMFLSFTRGVWIAGAVGLLISLLYVRKYKKIGMKRIAFLFMFFITLYTISSEIASDRFLEYKISNLFEIESGSGYSRVILWGAAFENIENNLLFGTGTYSFATIMGNGDYDHASNFWIGNTYITLLHDYGIIGFLLFSLFFVSLVWQGIRMIGKYFRNIENDDKWILLALCLSVISLYIAFFFTMGNSLAYSWLYMGLIAVYKRKLEKNMNVKS